MRTTLINGKWELQLLEHRAARPEWPYWEAHTLALAHHLIEPGTVVWDVGSEEGDFPTLFATWGAEVVLIEPNPNVWPQIKLHWEANTDKDPLGCVVGLASDETTFYTDYNARMDGIWPVVATGPINPEHGFRHIWEHKTVSPQFELDDLRFPMPDLITMDIEGGELHALKGAETILREHHPDVLVSVHGVFLKELYDIDDTEVFDYMVECGYDYRIICHDHETHVWFY